MENTITRLQNGMTKESLTFSISSILAGALDVIEMGLPDSLTAEERRSYSRNPLTEMTDQENGAVGGAISAVAIIVAQSINDGIGNSDADSLLGDFSSICDKFVASNWSNEGDTLRYRIKRKLATSSKGYNVSEVYLDYPNTDEIAARLITALNIE